MFGVSVIRAEFLNIFQYFLDIFRIFFGYFSDIFGTFFSYFSDIFCETFFKFFEDIWNAFDSTGVVMYEIFENKLPYFLITNNAEVKKKVMEGLELERPNSIEISDELHEMMRKCMEKNAENRITFDKINSILTYKLSPKEERKTRVSIKGDYTQSPLTDENDPKKEGVSLETEGETNKEIEGNEISNEKKGYTTSPIDLHVD